LFRRFLESYVDVCNNVVTNAANAVLMFEAGEQAAMDLKTSKLEDIQKEFEQDGIKVTFEISEKKIIFRVKGLPLKGKKCTYCDILRGFFGGIARKHIDNRFYSKKGAECVLEGAEECTFVAELIE
jgi:predicted hydrocarbon binding protein